jgi:hypothetical protein
MKGVLVLVCVLALSPAWAEELILWPEAFKAQGSQGSDLLTDQAPDSVRVIGGVWEGWMTIRLPVGTIIKSINYLHGGTIQYPTSLILYKTRYGNERVEVASGSSWASASGVVSLTLPPGGVQIRANAVYFLRAGAGQGATFNGARITY